MALARLTLLWFPAMPAQEQISIDLEEDSESEADLAATSPEEIREAFITGSDWTTETLVSQLRKGNIELNPVFQRREVWKPKRKSELIESIILNLPIPQIVLAERKDKPNTYIVLDGKQRLLSIRQFSSDADKESDSNFTALPLSGLTVRKDLNGQTYKDLADSSDHTSTINAFDNHVIRTVVIRNWPNDTYLHRVFLRLNTGSVRLSTQELRQALIPGPFTDFLEEFASTSKELQKALGIEAPDFRMRDNEIFLRYMAFAFRGEHYAGNLKKFMDESLWFLNEQWAAEEESIRAAAITAASAIETTLKIFGERDSFSTYNGEKFEGRFNRAVFDVMTYYFSDTETADAATQKSAAVKTAFIELSTENVEFLQSLTTTTKSKAAVTARFNHWGERLGSVIDTELSPPELR